MEAMDYNSGWTQPELDFVFRGLSLDRPSTGYNPSELHPYSYLVILSQLLNLIQIREIQGLVLTTWKSYELLKE